MKTKNTHNTHYLCYLHFIIVLFISLFSICSIGCLENAQDEYIINHTDKIIEQTSDNFTIEIWIENENDLQISDIQIKDLLNIQKIYYENTKIKELKDVMVWLPHDKQSWCEYRGNDCLEIGGYINWSTELKPLFFIILPWWNKDNKKLTSQYYIHELTHLVEYKQIKWTDNNHELDKYWNRDIGLMWQIYDKAISNFAP